MSLKVEITCRGISWWRKLIPRQEFHSLSQVRCMHTSYLSPRSPIYRWRKNWSCGEISDFNTQQMWRNQKFCQIWRNFKILHMTDVKKSEIYPVFGCEICFVAIYAIFCLNCFVVIYALLCGKKLSWKLYRWRKNDKYEVCPPPLKGVSLTANSQFFLRLPSDISQFWKLQAQFL